MIFVLFGATGDLASKKLIPALYQLAVHDELHEHLTIICVGRRSLDSVAYRQMIKSKLQGEYEAWETFSQNLLYQEMDFKNAEDYHNLKKLIHSLNPKSNQRFLYYLATAPRYFPVIVDALRRQDLVIHDDLRFKVIFEKPFGDDLATAQSYNKMLQTCLDESQIYRIDHYLGKEMIQNIQTIRWANKIFENIWNGEHIDFVRIYAFETEKIKDRGSYYDGVGAFKDMIQSHLLQVLALLTMEPPKGLNDDWIKNKKVEMIQKLKLSEQMVLGQYRGYREEKDVSPSSDTETFIALKAFLDAPQWQGVPFYLMTGKGLNEKRSAIEIYFKSADCFFEKGQILRNRITIEMYPKEGMTIRFNSKAPGLQSYIKPMQFEYCHSCQSVGNVPEAYEKLLLDAMGDDRSLFTRWDEVEASWQKARDVKELIRHGEKILYDDESEIFEKVKVHLGGDSIDF